MSGTMWIAVAFIVCALLPLSLAQERVTCAQAAAKAPKSAHWQPQCDAQGSYQGTQCNRKKECWCMTPDGQRLGPIWGKYKTPRLTDDPTWMPTDSKAPRPTCEMVNQKWAEFAASVRGL